MMTAVGNALLQPANSFAVTFQNRLAEMSGVEIDRTIGEIKRACGLDCFERAQLGDTATISRFLEEGQLGALQTALGLDVTFLDPLLAPFCGITDFGSISPKVKKELCAALQGFTASQDQLAPYKRFADTGYSKNWIAYKPGCFEAILLCWKPGQSTPIHDHARSWGADLVCEGVLFEDTFDEPDQGQDAVVFRARRNLSVGHVGVVGRQMIHRVFNEGQGPAVSLHLYFPPIAAASVRVYQEAEG